MTGIVLSQPLLVFLIRFRMDIGRVDAFVVERSFYLVTYVMRFIQRDGPVNEDCDIEEYAVPAVSPFDRGDPFHAVDLHDIVDVEFEILLMETVTQCKNRILAYFEASPDDQCPHYECKYRIGDGIADLCEYQTNPRADTDHAVGQVVDRRRLERTALRLFGEIVVIEVDQQHDESADEADPQCQGIRLGILSCGQFGKVIHDDLETDEHDDERHEQRRDVLRLHMPVRMVPVRGFQ